VNASWDKARTHKTIAEYQMDDDPLKPKAMLHLQTTDKRFHGEDYSSTHLNIWRLKSTLVNSRISPINGSSPDLVPVFQVVFAQPQKGKERSLLNPLNYHRAW